MEVDDPPALNTAKDRFLWRLPIAGAAMALFGFAFVASTGDDICTFLFNLFVVPFISIVLVIIFTTRFFALHNKRRQTSSILASFAVFWALSWLLAFNYKALHSSVRWFVYAKQYKAQVLAQPVALYGQLQHVEWDGWGFPGAGDTTMYLVYDPSDRLEAAVHSHARSKLAGLPCEVSQIARKQKDWYLATFYTDTDWDNCE